MASKTERYNLSEAELRAFARECREGERERLLQQLKEELPALSANLDAYAMAELDLVPEHVVLSFLDKRSRKTLERWGVPVAARKGNTRFYDPDEVFACIREE